MNPETQKYFEAFHEKAMNAKAEQLEHHARELAAAMLANDPLRASVHVLCARDAIGAELTEQHPLWLAFMVCVRAIIKDPESRAYFSAIRTAVEDDYRERRDAERAQD